MTHDGQWTTDKGHRQVYGRVNRQIQGHTRESNTKVLSIKSGNLLRHCMCAIVKHSILS